MVFGKHSIPNDMNAVLKLRRVQTGGFSGLLDSSGFFVTPQMEGIAAAANLEKEGSLYARGALFTSMNTASGVGVTTAAVTDPRFSTRILLFPDGPAIPKLGEVTVGYLPPLWVKIMPRSNVKIDFSANNNGIISSIIQLVGIPRGYANLAKAANLRSTAVNTYLIDGIGNYDFLVHGGMISWLKGDQGAKVIESTFGIGPDTLDVYQKEMLYSKE